MDDDASPAVLDEMDDVQAVKTEVTLDDVDVAPGVKNDSMLLERLHDPDPRLTVATKISEW